MPLALATATNLVPSADEATVSNLLPGTRLRPRLGKREMAVSKAAEATSRFPKVFIGRLNEPLSFNHFMKSCQVSHFLMACRSPGCNH